MLSSIDKLLSTQLCSKISRSHTAIQNCKHNEQYFIELILVTEIIPSYTIK